MQTWLAQQREIEAQDAYRNSRDFQRRYEEYEANKERAADYLEPTAEEFEEEELERSRR